MSDWLSVALWIITAICWFASGYCFGRRRAGGPPKGCWTYEELQDYCLELQKSYAKLQACYAELWAKSEALLEAVTPGQGVEKQ